MGTAAQALGVALSLLMTIAPARSVNSGETLEELQRRFDNEADGVNKAKMLQKLGDAQFVREREAVKASDFSTAGLIMEKYRDIAVLMSMGTRKAQVRKVFIAQGALIGLVGTAVGLVLGYVLSWTGGHYHVFALAPEVYSIDYVPFAPRVIDGFLVAVVAIGTSLVATIYPSWSAARILPAESLRYE